MADEPILGLLVDQMQPLPQRVIRLLFQLQRIPSVGPHGRPVCQHNRQPGAAGKAGYKRQSFRRFRDIFAQMFVGPRNHKPIQPLRRHSRAQSCQPKVMF